MKQGVRNREGLKIGRHIIKQVIGKCSGLLSPLGRNPSDQAFEASGARWQGQRRGFCLHYSEVYPVFALMTPPLPVVHAPV